MRKIIVIISGVIILLTINITIYNREQLLTKGRTIFLELALPTNPRSIMLGENMSLRFEVLNDAFGADYKSNIAKDGRLVLALDKYGIATFRRFDNGSPLGNQEVVIRYRVRDGKPFIASNSFISRENAAKCYKSVSFGEFRLATNGDAILTSLRGENLEQLDFNMQH